MKGAISVLLGVKGLIEFVCLTCSLLLDFGIVAIENDHNVDRLKKDRVPLGKNVLSTDITTHLK